MLITAFLGGGNVPFRNLHLFFDHVAVNIVKSDSVLCYLGYFSRFGGVILLCVLQYGGHIRSDIHLALSYAYDKGTLPAHRINLVFMFAKNDSEGISAF